MRGTTTLCVALSTALSLCACDKKKAPKTDPTEAKADEEKEKAAKEKPEPQECSPFASLDELKAWTTEVESLLEEGKPEEVAKKIRCYDEGYQGGLMSEADEHVAEFFRGQLDDDEPVEWAVQIRQHGPLEGQHERKNFFWIGVFDHAEGGHTFADSIVRPKLYFCEQTKDKTALRFGFVTEKPGPKAGMVMVEQDMKMCGTMVEVHYQKKLYRLEDGELVATEKKPPKPVKFDTSRPVTKTNSESK